MDRQLSENKHLGEPDLVMAWAMRTDTGSLCYILELKRDQTGAQCGCECISCHLPLQAVNAGKDVFRQRPHFRHPVGSPRHSCLVLAARAAVMLALSQEGTFVLPRRQRRGRVIGLSGHYHEAWVEAPPEQISIDLASFSDPLSATLVLDDGRELLVQVVGSADVDTNMGIKPSISIVVDDPAIAGMSFSDIRARLSPLIAVACWQTHWNDAQLQQRADQAAYSIADENLDRYDGNVDDLGDTLAQRSESLLHLEVKQILARRRTLRLPVLEVSAYRELGDGSGTESRRRHLPATWAKLNDVRLEKKVGSTRPDVLAAVDDGTQLMIEVTVTNTITDERASRISTQGIAAVEIDLSRMGGRVTRTELERIVIEEVVAKRWIYHPKRESIVAHLLSEIDADLTARARRSHQLHLMRLFSPGEWGEQYLASFEEYAGARSRIDSGHGDDGLSDFYLDELREAALALAGHGYPEAEDVDFYRSSKRVLERILSIKSDRGVGYNLDTGWKVINAILQDRLTSRSEHTLYLIACRVYSPALSDRQRHSVDTWRENAFDSLSSGEDFYRRDRRFDRLIALLFPETRELLVRPLPGEKY